MAKNKSKRRLLSYSLYGLVVLLVLVAIPAVWFARAWNEYKVERQALAAISQMQSAIPWDENKVLLPVAPRSSNAWAISPRWLQRLSFDAGIPWFENRITRVVLYGEGFDDSVIPHLQQFKRLERVDFLGTNVTEEGTNELKRTHQGCSIHVQPEATPDEYSRHVFTSNSQ